MAKPIIPDKMSAQMRTGKAAALFVEAKIEEVSLHTKPAMGGEVEGIHDMRVAVKRLREGLRLFRPVLPRKRRRRVMLDVEELNDALGRVRDPDVMMAHAAWVAEQDEAAREATAAASGLWAEARQAALQRLIEVHQRITDSQRLEGRLRQLVSAAAKRHRGPNDLPLDAFSYLAVTASAERVRDRLTRLGRDGDPTALHRIRIAVKRLKYSIEPFRTILPALDEAYRPVADTQEALGLVHDFDILEEALAGLSDGSSTEAALHIVREQRAVHHSEALTFMAILGKEPWRRSLLDALD
jgi:CHAD domain-containing protein